MPLWVAVELLRMHQLPHVPTLPCELEGCGHVIHRNGGMPLWVAVELLGMHQEDHVPLVRQPVQQEKVVTQQVPCTQQPEASTQQEVVTQQVPGTQQPEHRHAEVVVEDHADNRRNQVPLSMGGGGSCTTSSRESDNVCLAQPKKRGVTTSLQESDKFRQALTKQRGATTDPQLEANGTKKATEGESALYGCYYDAPQWKMGTCT